MIYIPAGSVEKSHWPSLRSWAPNAIINIAVITGIWHHYQPKDKAVFSNFSLVKNVWGVDIWVGLLCRFSNNTTMYNFYLRAKRQQVNVTILEGGEWRMGIFLPSVEGSTEGTPRGCRRPPRGVPEVYPDTRGGITHALEHGQKYWHYFSWGAKCRSVCAKRP